MVHKQQVAGDKTSKFGKAVNCLRLKDNSDFDPNATSFQGKNAPDGFVICPIGLHDVVVAMCQVRI